MIPFSPPGEKLLSPSLKVMFAEIKKPSSGIKRLSSENIFISTPLIDDSPAFA